MGGIAIDIWEKSNLFGSIGSQKCTKNAFFPQGVLLKPLVKKTSKKLMKLFFVSILGKEGLKDFLLQLSLGAATVIGIIFIIFLIAYLIKDIKRQKFTNVQMNEDNFCDKNVSLPQILLV